MLSPNLRHIPFELLGVDLGDVLANYIGASYSLLSFRPFNGVFPLLFRKDNFQECFHERVHGVSVVKTCMTVKTLLKALVRLSVSTEA